LARHREIIRFARRVVRRFPLQHRLARIAALLTFMGRLIDAQSREGWVRAPDSQASGVDLMLAVLGEHRGPAVVLASLLMALGERARLECTREMAFVQVELAAADLRHLPPFARVHVRRGRYFLPLDPRRGRSPVGFLPLPIRDALSRRRALAALAGSAA
jgi:hypothetical protein